MQTYTQPLLNKTALITGGSRGIGRAIALRLAKDGAKFIAIHYHQDVSAAQAVVAEIKTLGVMATALQADFMADGYQGALTLWQAYTQAATQAVGEIDLDILVNNAGIAPIASLSQVTPKVYEELMNINVAAILFMLQNANPHIRNGGRIINLSTCLTRIALPSRAVYAASKGAINSLTLALAPEFGTRNITINALSPAATSTDMNRHWLTDEKAKTDSANASVFKRVGESHDIADVAAFLASEDSRWITGQIIDVSGGSYL